MTRATTPYTLFVNHVHTLRACLPGVGDGRADSIHDARVATRRIREMVLLAGQPPSSAADDLSDQFKRMGRALGRVRDADVRVELIAGLESRIPHAAPWLVTVRHAQERRRLKLMRRLIRRLERLGIPSLLEHVIAQDAAIGRSLERASRTGRWRNHLCRSVTSRATLTADAIERATGVYFPKRVHGARIAIKKLRYALEIASATGREDLAAPLRDLKKGQEVLGDLHDRQALLDDLRPPESADPAQPDAFNTLVRQVLEAEIHALHKRYLERRTALLQIARAAQAMQIDRRWHIPALATAGALALSSGVYVVQRRLAGAR